jgi:hypothetical protein
VPGVLEVESTFAKVPAALGLIPLEQLLTWQLYGLSVLYAKSLG